MKIKEICFEIVDKCVCEIKQKENIDKIKLHVLDPCVKYLVEQFYPYIITTCIIFILTLLLCIIMTTILLKDKLFL